MRKAFVGPLFVGVFAVLVFACSGSSSPAATPTNASGTGDTSSSSSSSSSSSGGGSSSKCEVALKDPKTDCEKAWSGYETWLKNKCTSGKRESKDEFMKSCTSDKKPEIVAHYGCFTKHAKCEEYMTCLDHCSVEALK